MANLFLFIPFGFLLIPLIPKNESGRRAFRSILITAGVSLTIETLQIILRGRFPAFSDLLANTVGGAIGFFIGKKLEQKQVLLLHDTGSPLQITPNIQKCFVRLLLLYSVFLFYLPFFSMEGLANLRPDVQLVIGNNPEQTRPWKGKIISLAIYDRALSRDQIQRRYRNGSLQSAENILPQGPLAFYSFEKRQKGFILDQSLKKPPLDLALLPAADEKAIDPSGLILNGSTFLVSQGKGSKIDEPIRATRQLTVEAWIDPERQFDAGGRFVSFVQGDRTLFYLQQDIDEIVLGINAGVLRRGRLHAEEMETTLAIPTNNPVYLAAVYSPDKMSLYFNGENVAEGFLTDGFFLLANYLNLDRMTRGGRGVLGILLFWPFGLLLSLTLKASSINRITAHAALGSLFLGLLLAIQTQHPSPFFTLRTAGVPFLALALGMISGEGIKRKRPILPPEPPQR